MFCSRDQGMILLIWPRGALGTCLKIGLMSFSFDLSLGQMRSGKPESSESLPSNWNPLSRPNPLGLSALFGKKTF